MSKVPLVCGLRSTANLYDTEGERKIAEILEERLTPTYIHVRDISGELELVLMAASLVVCDW